MFLLLYQDAEDPIVTSIQDCQDQLGEKLITISMAELLSDARIFDVIDDGIPTIQWQFAEHGTITNSPDCKLINRVSMLSADLFADFHPDDRDYAHAEFSAYMTFAINAFPAKLNTPSFFGLSGNQYPLPLQWNKIKKLHPELRVPHFYLGGAAHCPFDEDRDDVVYSSTYAFHHWRCGPRPDARSLFAFLRPRGQALFTFVARDEAFTVPLPGQPAPAADLGERLSELGIAIAAAFDCSIAELLFFVDGPIITFGVLDVRPFVTDKSPAFRETLMRGLHHHFQVD